MPMPFNFEIPTQSGMQAFLPNELQCTHRMSRGLTNEPFWQHCQPNPDMGSELF